MELVIRELVISYKLETYENFRIKLNVGAMHRSTYNYPISLKLNLVLCSTDHRRRNTCKGFMVECHTLLTLALYGADRSASRVPFLSGVEHGLASKLQRQKQNTF